MRIANLYSLPGLSGILIFLSIIVMLVNHVLYQFPGNTFFPDNMVMLTFNVLLIYLGLVLTFGINSNITNRGLEFFYFFILMSIIALASNAVQLTPFMPIDKHILTVDRYFHINIPSMLIWMHEHPHFRNVLGFIYDTLPFQMSLLPILVIASGKFHVFREYYFLMVFTTLIGFCFYYFFPTTAPASIIKSPYFMPEQIATGLKFTQIHQHQIPTTDEGGLIALPSFHTIWALLCVYLLKEWTIPCIILLLVNLGLLASCVLLGWHYFTDVVAGIALSLLAYHFLSFYKLSSTLNRSPYFDSKVLKRVSKLSLPKS